MGQPAARVGDMHTCPMVTPGTPPIPHVGGPVLPPGGITVLIGGQPAARQGDMCTCVGPPDAISMGSPIVRVVGMSAARMGDPTLHGGVIVMGLPTVLIGVNPAGKPPSPYQAVAVDRPSPVETQEIQDALDSGDNQKAIDLTIEHYGIDTSNVPNGVVFDAAEPNYGVADFQGNVSLGNAAMASPDTLASTIAHETTHSNQAAAQRAADPTLTDWPSGAESVNMDEAGAYHTELSSAQNTGLNPSEVDLAAQRYGEHYNGLSDAGQARLDSGVYP